VVQLTPSRYHGEDHYIPRYILIAISLLLAVSAVRSGQRLDRVIGIAVLAVSGGLLIYIARAWIFLTGHE
jgi:hypothetical protein